jgi:NTE family protein
MAANIGSGRFRRAKTSSAWLSVSGLSNNCRAQHRPPRTLHGLPQTFRAIIHSRMQVGLSKYEAQYQGADVLLFGPTSDDAEMFFTNLFSYSTRRHVCEHAYQRTRYDLLKRRHELEPLFARHGIMLNIDMLKDNTLTLNSKEHGTRQGQGEKLRGVALDLADTLADLQRWVETQKVA